MHPYPRPSVPRGFGLITLWSVPATCAPLHDGIKSVDGARDVLKPRGSDISSDSLAIYIASALTPGIHSGM